MRSVLLSLATGMCCFSRIKNTLRFPLLVAKLILDFAKNDAKNNTRARGWHQNVKNRECQRDEWLLFFVSSVSSFHHPRVIFAFWVRDTTIQTWTYAAYREFMDMSSLFLCLMTADDEESTHNKIQNFNRETIYAKIISSNIIFTMNGRMQI